MSERFMATINLPRRGFHTKERAQKFDPFFEVKDVPISFKGMDFGDRYLINGITGDKVGMVSDRYKLTTHKEVSDLTKSILDRAGLQYEVKASRTSNNGSRFFEDIIFPSLAFNAATGVASTALDSAGLTTDEFFPRITEINSYDKTHPVIYVYGMYRKWCMNGAVLPIKVTRLSFRHTMDVDKDRVKETLIQSLEDSHILMQRVYDKLNVEPGLPLLAKVLSAGFSDKFLKTLIDKLSKEDNSYSIDFDEEIDPKTGKATKLNIKSIATKASAYAIYNVVTDVATHTITDRAKQETANEKIAKLFIAA